MRAEMVVFHVAASMDIDPLRELWPNSIPPVVIVREAAAWPSWDRNAQFVQVLHRLLAITVDIRNRKAASDPDAAVNSRSQVLDKLPVQVWTDRQSQNPIARRLSAD